MRAKLKIQSITQYDTYEELKFAAVGKKGAYDENGSDEDNTYARYTPSANLDMTIVNPALIGKYHAGQEFYVDFTPVENE